MRVMQAYASTKSAVLSFPELRDYDELHRVYDVPGIRLAESWFPVKGKIARAEPKGFVWMGTFLACDAPTWLLLKSDLQQDVEGLPVVVGDSQFFVFNPFKIIDCFDPIRGIYMSWYPDKTKKTISKYSFFEEMLLDTYIFRIPESSKATFVTDRFYQLIYDLKIPGLEFQSLPSV